MLNKSKLVEIRPSRFVTLCGRIFHNTDPQYFPRAEHRGRTLYLCTEACLGAFQSDPKRFYDAHRMSANQHSVIPGQRLR
jgi:YHS domain-containing protein